MDIFGKMDVEANEFARGQTMTEYALILATVAVVVFAGYQTMGTNVTSLVNTVNEKL